ncbi:MAG: hypothetical protein HND43_04020 [Armatimonadetes bacterium]|nr:hypothetical protein [Armatimonadota bacterium]MCK6632957.1 hypothetical protein [Fimbriimonadaceae bacterium]NOG38543.1 hypothetical protein [Armatimonadota bacterium]NUM39166.1 hypothetical protein [Armatimonadota bacterium]GIK32158.1 MAG: protein-arginine kinase [Armatimonadota bacterium]
MPPGAPEADSWRELVMRSMSAPAWLKPGAPHDDVVLSTRARVMRNLRGFRFPHNAPPDELEQILASVSSSASQNLPNWTILSQLSPSERDYLIGCRLISPRFPVNQPGRAVVLEAKRLCSVMVNEEDHLRIQSLSPGWSLRKSRKAASETLDALARDLEFAESPRFGYLSASPYNCGSGIRLSSMVHLIGLAHAKRLPNVLRALADRGVVARGLFGESSRAVGAFLQVSIVSGAIEAFVGAVQYLIDEERRARESISTTELEHRVQSGLEYVATSGSVQLSEALRVLAWVRWGATAAQTSGVTHRDVDTWLATLDFRGPSDEVAAGQQRARFLKERLLR